MLESIVQFAFIVLLPLVLVAGGLVTLFLVSALLEALEHPDELSARIEAAFRRPPRPPKAPPAEHYYKPYWQA
jgi:hypothetical protein